jgi:tetratricopeptide (TPR) repeat protein
MNTMMVRSKWLPWMLLILLWETAFALACYIDAGSDKIKHMDSSVLDRVLGASRTAFGNEFYMEADRYFHLGVGHAQQRAFTGLFEKWADTLLPNIHVHPEGTDINEILPWLRFSTAMDPHNMDAYLNAAFWLAGQGERPDLAETILLEAQQNNPADYRVYQQKGRLYMVEQQSEKAAGSLEAGIRLWPGRQDSQDEQTRLDLAQMLACRAFLYEMKGKKEKALELFKQSFALSPQNQGLARQIEMLTRGEDVSLIAKTAWKELFPYKQTCAREEEAHGQEPRSESVHNEENHPMGNHKD